MEIIWIWKFQRSRRKKPVGLSRGPPRWTIWGYLRFRGPPQWTERPRWSGEQCLSVGRPAASALCTWSQKAWSTVWYHLVGNWNPYNSSVVSSRRNPYNCTTISGNQKHNSPSIALVILTCKTFHWYRRFHSVVPRPCWAHGSPPPGSHSGLLSWFTTLSPWWSPFSGRTCSSQPPWKNDSVEISFNLHFIQVYPLGANVEVLNNFSHINVPPRVVKEHRLR